MKNLFILGTARSGKSTLARMVNRKFGHSIVAIDALVSGFQEVFPQIGIKHNSICDPLISPFVASYINSTTFNHPDNLFVVEGWHMHPKSAARLLERDKYHIVVLGYPELSPEEAFQNIRKYAGKNDYTREMTDEHLLDLLIRHINHAKGFREDCCELNLPFYDTSFDREKVLAGIINDLESVL